MTHHKTATILVALTIIIWGSSVTFAQELAPKSAEIDAREAAIQARAQQLRELDAEKKVEKERTKDDDKYVRKAREEQAEAEKDERKKMEREWRALQAINLRGCDDNPPSYVNPSIGNEWGLRETSANNQIVIDIFNPSPSAVDITSTVHGDMVTGLCSGGRMRLVFGSRDFGPQRLEIILTAEAQSAGAGQQTDSIGFSIYRSNRAQTHESLSKIWKINPHR